MSHTENILGMLSDRAGTGKDSQIYTPIPIAKDMVNILPEEVWNKDTTFLEIILLSLIQCRGIIKKCAFAV